MPSLMSIIVVDDDAPLRESLAANLEHEQYSVRMAASASEALELLRQSSFDVALCDFAMPEIDGLQFVKQCSEVSPDTAVVLMTAFGNLDLVAKAIRGGASDYLAKPFSMDALLVVLKKIEERKHLLKENEELRQEISQRYSFANIIAHSQVMHGIFETVKRLANFTTTVLIIGESGTGKELVARAIHHNSPRRGKPFIAINCGAIPETLMESELFGHRKGAFTDATRDKRGLLEEASGGTIFLDEIGEMPLHLQVKLLRALQEQQIRRVGDENLLNIDVRVIAATLRDLEEDVRSGRFRDDLFYRLNVVSIRIPPLRERPEDIPVLVQHFMKKHNKRLGLNVSEVSSEALRCMLGYHWRGNVRELENCIERAMVLTESGRIDVEALPDSLRAASAGVQEGSASEVVESDSVSIKARTRVLEIDLIQRALQRTGGNRTRAAKLLEISHRALLYKLKEYGLGGSSSAEQERADQQQPE